MHTCSLVSLLSLALALIGGGPITLAAAAPKENPKKAKKAEAGESAAKAKPPKKEKAEEEGKAGGEDKDKVGSAFAVVQVGDQVRVLKDAEIGAAREKSKQDYDAEVKAYDEARKAALKAKKKFTDAKPTKPVFKIVATALKSEEAAGALRKKTLERIEKQKKKEREERANKR